jgi:hypothetical protein
MASLTSSVTGAGRAEADADEVDALELGSETPVEVRAGPRRMSALAWRRTTPCPLKPTKR